MKKTMKKTLFFVALCAVLVGVGLWFGKARHGKQDIATQVKVESSRQEILAKQQEQINKAEINHKIAKLHIPFIANQGQTDGRVKFYAHTFGGTVFITEEGKIVYSLPKKKSEPGLKDSRIPEPRTPNPINVLALKEELVGGKISEIKGEGEAVTKVSYFKGNDQSKWKSNIPTYDLVSLGKVYKGVELKLKAYGNNVEKLFYVKPEAEPERIRVKLSGGKLNVNKDGELEVGTELGTVKFTKPVAYQENGGKKEFVEVAYVVKGDEYGFKVGEYDRGKDLLIDPILASTFLGGSGSDSAFAIAFDSTDNVYVAGETSSSDFPGIDAESADSLFINGEAFVAKLDSDLSSILAATFLGGGNSEDARAIVLDSTGNPYVAGVTSSSDFPGVDAGSADNIIGGFNEAYVAKLDADLSSILAATFLGGSSAEFIPFLALEITENVYVAGVTFSSDFPGVDAGSADNIIGGFGEAYAAKLNSDLSSIVAATFLGGSEADSARAIIFDSTGNVYVAGGTSSSDFPGIDAGSADNTAEDEEAFVAKLDSDLSSILAATFLGGLDDLVGESACAIALDSVGDVYVAGGTGAPDFPGIDAGSADNTFTGFEEAFVAKFDPDLSSESPPTGDGSNGCSIAGGSVEARQAGANILIPLISALAISLRMLRRGKEER